MAVRIGSRTIQLNHAPSIVGFAAVGAKKEKEGPLADYFDYRSPQRTVPEPQTIPGSDNVRSRTGSS